MKHYLASLTFIINPSQHITSTSNFKNQIAYIYHHLIDSTEFQLIYLIISKSRMQALSETFINTAPLPNAAPNSSTTIQSHPQNTAPKRRLTQRVFVKDRPEVICQMQINEIQKLSEQLANYKQQYRMATGSNLEQQSREKRPSFNARPTNSNQTLKQIIITGESYRNELMAAQEKRMHLSRQNAIIQKQIETFSREKQALIAEINNERSKSSILEQELFMMKDTFQKYKNKSDAQKHELVYQIKTLRANVGDLQAIVKSLSPKVNVLPFYEQKIAENEYKMGLMNQQLMQVRGDLRYYQQKSNYFESNYTVLNENFNNLYNTNFNTTNELKEAKNINIKLEMNEKNLEEECKRLNSKCFQLAEEKNKLIAQLNSQIVLLGERIKGEHKAAEYNEKANEKLNFSLDQIRKMARDLEIKNQHLEKEIESKTTIIHGQKIINEQLQSSLKQLQLNIVKKDEFWKNTLANQLGKLSNESNSKALSISSELIKSQQNAKMLSISLTKSQQQLEVLKQKAGKLQKQLETAHYQLEEKEKAITALKEQHQKAKIEIITCKSSINEYQNKLGTALSVQQQITSSSKIHHEQKSAKIKQLQAKVQHLISEDLKHQLQSKDLLDKIAKLTQISTMLKGQLEIAQEELTNFEEKLKDQQRKSGWLIEQNHIKQQIIAKYNSVTQEMREKISNYYNDITELNDKNALLQEQLEQFKKLIQVKESQMNLQAKTIQEQAQNLQIFQAQTQKLKAVILVQSNVNAKLTEKNKQISQNILVLLQKLTKSENSFLQLEIALKETVEDLAKKNEQSLNKVNEQYSFKVGELERNSQIIKQQKGLIIDGLNQDIQGLKSTINGLQDLNNQLQDQLSQANKDLFASQQANIALKGEIQSKSLQIASLITQREQMAHLIEVKTENIQKLKISLIELDQTYRSSIEQNARKHEQKKNLMITQWNTEREALSQKVQEGNNHLLRKTELEQELNSVSILNQNYKNHLENEQIRLEHLTLENEQLRKTLKQTEQTFVSRLLREVQLKFKYEQDQFDKLNSQIEKLNLEKTAMKEENQKLSKHLSEKMNESSILLKQNEKMEQILKKNMEIHRAEVEFLKKINIQLQIQHQNLIQSSQHDSRIKSDLSHSVSALQQRNFFLEEYMNRSKVEIASIQQIFQELKQERDLLIKKYIVLTNEIYKINAKDVNLNRQLDSFALYFSKVSALHTEINKHLYNITHFSQIQTVKIGSTFGQQSSRIEQSLVEKVNN